MTKDIDTLVESESLAATPQKVFSEAYNLSGLTSSVNNRTGSFQASVILAQLSRGLQCPASFNLILFVGAPNHYGNMVSGTAATAYFGFNVPRLVLTPIESRMYCANGAVEEIVVPTNNDENKLGMLYHRTKDMLIERVPQPPYPTPIWDDKYQVSYKNGTVEYYDKNGYLEKIISSAGHVLSFYYYSNNTLKKVSDEDENSIELNYVTQGDNTTLTVTQLIAGEKVERKVTISRIMRDSVAEYFVDNVTMPNSKELIRFLRSNILGQPYLGAIIQPTGLAQIVYHKAIKYSDTQDIYVVELLLEKDAGEYESAGTPQIKVKYDYSEHNFTGYTKGWTPISGVDNCIRHTTDYTYTVTEKHSDMTIERTFNRFHLLIKEITRDANGFNSQTDDYTYHVVAGDIRQQPHNYSFWKKLKTTFRRCESTREEFQERTHDDFGNLLSQKQASGIKIENKYYPENSTVEEGCPPDPKGYFQGYLKETVTSPNPNAEIKPENKVSTFKYSRVDGYSYNDPNTGRVVTPYMILPSVSIVNGVNTGDIFYKLKSEITTTENKIFVGVKYNIASTSAGCTCLEIYSWGFDERKVKVSTEYTAWKNSEGDSNRVIQLRGSSSFSLASGKVYTEVSAAGDTTKYEYNDQGFLTKKTSFFDTPAVEVERYEFQYWYKFSPPICQENRCKLTTANNQVFNYYYNRNGQLTYVELVGELESQILQKLTYNQQGLMETDTLYEKGVNGNSFDDITVESTTRYTYQMRNLILSEFADGTQEYLSENPVLRMQKRYSQPKGAVYLTFYNQYGLPGQSRVTFYESGSDVRSEATLEKNVYDGFGRLIEVTNSSGGVTSFEYDTLDRVVKEKVADAGFSPHQPNVTAYGYSSYIPVMDLPTRIESSIAQSQIMLAARTYDLLGRLEEQKTPGGVVEVVEKYLYSNSQSQQPSTVRINPGATPNENDGEMAYTYDPVTQLVTESVSRGISSIPVATSKFYYDNLTKQITRSTIESEGTQCVCKYTYNAFGSQLSMGTTTAKKGESYELTMRYSSSSKFVNFKDVMLESQQNQLKLKLSNGYDSIGRLTKRIYEAIKENKEIESFGMEIQVSVQYLPMSSGFGAGQVGSIVVLVLNPNSEVGTPPTKMEISFGYDQFAMEAYREYKINGVFVLRIENSFMPNLMLAKKVSKKTDTAIIHQTFSYHQSYGQLSLSTSGASPETSTSTSYTFNGLYRINTVVEPSATTQYTYLKDRVVSYRAGSEAIQGFSYDSRGNVMTDNSQSMLKYNAANQLVWFNRTGEQRYTYMYTPSGQLSQIESPTGEVNTYMYDEENLIGEMSGDLKALYLEVNGIRFGRYVQSAEIEQLELYAVEISGSVRCVCKYDSKGVELDKMYYNYSDYGERKEW
ncbi:RHS repeat domain-containing protein [Pseudomonas chlororaphis]|uniref:RHS repeat domain-containing protein n=1 Tax=Pseudomonas chlororaphis TaxID=587753 RepID=UPI0015DE4294|nr:RHS repeat domain-containing protein [Pseudomonas chlororaphis]QLL16010.1 RHS repeat protein [Pseudomonas chlororaphis subsp. aurantiaca]